MMVLTVSKCPPGLRGDITKWLQEIGTGVYVGSLNARVRDKLWDRVCEHIGSGEAVMVFPAKNEQGYAFYVHNSQWTPRDFDGIVLMQKPLPLPASKMPVENKERRKRGGIKEKSINSYEDVSASILGRNISAPGEFVVVDLETTGLKSETDSIIEIAAVKYSQWKFVDEFQALVQTETEIPGEIVKLTGITNDEIEKQGISLQEALVKLFTFIGDNVIIGHYIRFDIKFLINACKRVNIELGKRICIDTIALVKGKYGESLENYRLESIVKEMGIAEKQEHRALPDAKLAAEVYLRLNEK